MKRTQMAEKRKVGVHVSLDLEILASLDAQADRLGMTRSELLRHMIADWAETADEERWMAEQAEAALSEDHIPWEQAKAELSL